MSLAIESFDSCTTLAYTDFPSFVTVKQISPSEIQISAAPTSDNVGAFTVVFRAVDTMSTWNFVQVSFNGTLSKVTSTTRTDQFYSSTGISCDSLVQK